MKITKILASEATPAKAILNRAQHVALTSAQRKNLPDAIELDGQSIEVSVADKRALSVGDVLLDESGHFYVIDAAPENILIIKGDEEFAAEAAVALLNRGIEVAQVEGGFAIAKDEQLQQLLTDAGLEFEEVQLLEECLNKLKAGYVFCRLGEETIDIEFRNRTKMPELMKNFDFIKDISKMLNEELKEEEEEEFE